jgi:beta-N-acetylhexosaminidase
MVLLCNQSLDGGAAVDELLDGWPKPSSRAAGSPAKPARLRRLALLPRLAGAAMG